MCIVNKNGKELTDILHATKEILQKTKRDDQKLEKICSIDYGSKQVQNHSVPSIDPNSEGQYAYRYYGSGTPFSLTEILGSIFQNYYCNYKAVLLIDAESGISPKEGLKDLTGGQLIIETEVDAAAQKFEDIIKEKRAGLGIDNGINKGGDAIC